ncbi:MAG: SDR family oxidoreductase [Chloroflexi bacterium]|nr:SDR family oxidoreductase [Chloroflexota bacterium]
MTSSVVVTGCGTGLGRAIFERLIKDGWAVVGLELDSGRAADARSVPGAGDVIEGDAGDRGDLGRARARAVQLAPLGGWVNNAALPLPGNLHDPKQDEVERLFRVSLMGYYWGCSEAIQQFVAQKSAGAIVNISSIHARAAFTGWAAYDTAKGGINSLTRYIAVEYGPLGIRANAIEPGAMRTDLLQQVIDRDPDPAHMERDMAAIHPMNRIGEASEIGSVASFLLSGDASFVSGQCIPVDGAATARCHAYPVDPALVEAYGLPTA